MQNYSRSRKNKTYICKPDSGCQGRGIFITRTVKDIKPGEDMICQLYISKVLLPWDYLFLATATSCSSFTGLWEMRGRGLAMGAEPSRVFCPGSCQSRPSDQGCDVCLGKRLSPLCPCSWSSLTRLALVLQPMAAGGHLWSVGAPLHLGEGNHPGGIMVTGSTPWLEVRGHSGIAHHKEGALWERARIGKARPALQEALWQK